ncbi:MAG: hypothetical protein IIC64_11190 [SAR324 cluster bacterium]|nr:hypothetical protein [SAR324 cluster bacterium]
MIAVSIFNTIVTVHHGVWSAPIEEMETYLNGIQEQRIDPEVWVQDLQSDLDIGEMMVKRIGGTILLGQESSLEKLEFKPNAVY